MTTGEQRVRDWEQGRYDWGARVGAHYGMTWVSHDGNEALLHWETREHDTFIGPKGRIVHGGLVAFLAETGMGTATMLTCGEGEEFATVEFNIQLQRPAPIGLLSCEARVTRRAKTVAFCEATVKDGEGRVVAKASETNLILAASDERQASAQD